MSESNFGMLSDFISNRCAIRSSSYSVSQTLEACIINYVNWQQAASPISAPFKGHCPFSNQYEIFLESAMEWAWNFSCMVLQWTKYWCKNLHERQSTIWYRNMKELFTIIIFGLSSSMQRKAHTLSEVAHEVARMVTKIGINGETQFILPQVEQVFTRHCESWDLYCNLLTSQFSNGKIRLCFCSLYFLSPSPTYSLTYPYETVSKLQPWYSFGTLAFVK